MPEDAPLGARYIDYAGLDDPVIDISVTPNRPDALGVYGVARDLAARGVGRLKDGAVKPVPGAFPCPIKVTLHASVKSAKDGREAACPLIVGRLIEGVTNGPSPDWLQRRLKAIGLRPINALVDITNYLTFDRARPLHVFDADKIEGGVQVRLAKNGETLTALDGKTYEFDDQMAVVCDKDGARVESIGGVMGGEASGCDEATTRVFLESAYFDPTRTATTGRKLKIHSDARYRYERGVDPDFAAPGAELATRMILELCGGRASEIVVVGKPPKISRKIKLRAERVASLVGMEIPPKEQARILEALGFEVAIGRKDQITATTPSWRPDVHGEADLVEEVARIASLTKLEAQPMARADGVPRPVLTLAQRRGMRARRRMAAAGLHECVTYSFISDDEAALFGGGAAAMRVDNPIASDKSVMRPSLAPGLLSAAARNQARGALDVALFEIGPEFTGPKPGEQREAAVGLRVGAIAARDWSGARRPVDLYDAKADALALLEEIGVPVDKLMLDRETSGWLHPGRSARLKLGPKLVLAEFGEVHPRALSALDVKGPAAAFWVALDAAPAPKAKGKARPPLTLHDLQPVERDFAFVVGARVEAEDMLRGGAERRQEADCGCARVRRLRRQEGRRAIRRRCEVRRPHRDLAADGEDADGRGDREGERRDHCGRVGKDRRAASRIGRAQATLANHIVMRS